VVVLSNAVRVTFTVAPPREFFLDFNSDFRIVRLETSPIERSLNLDQSFAAGHQLSGPTQTEIFPPFNPDYSLEIELQQYAVFEDDTDLLELFGVTV